MLGEYQSTYYFHTPQREFYPRNSLSFIQLSEFYVSQTGFLIIAGTTIKGCVQLQRQSSYKKTKLGEKNSSFLLMIKKLYYSFISYVNRNMQREKFLPSWMQVVTGTRSRKKVYLQSVILLTYILKEDFGFYNEKHQFFEGQAKKIANTCKIQKL